MEKGGTPSPPVAILYRGDLKNIPSTASKLAKLSVGQLRAILHFHGLPIGGIKDELIIRICFLKSNRIAAIFAREERQLKDLINIAYDLIHSQRMLSINNHIYTRRTYLSTENKICVPLPLHIKDVSDLCHLFDPIIQFIDIIHEQRSIAENITPINTDPHCITDKMDLHENDIKDQVCLVGSKITVKWTKEDVKDSGWKPGWYSAFVQEYNEDEDEITITYPSEPGCVYTMAVVPAIAADTIRIIRSAI